MAEITKVEVTYQSNYNGCSVYGYTADGTEVDTDEDARLQTVSDKIVDEAYKECNPHGEFYGDTDELEEFAKKAVHEAFGEHVEVTFEEDNMST